MTVTREEMRKIRLQLVHKMHDYIMNTGDEEIYIDWMTLGVPDEPCEEDFEYFANNPTEFARLCELFGILACQDEEENY